MNQMLLTMKNKLSCFMRRHENRMITCKQRVILLQARDRKMKSG